MHSMTTSSLFFASAYTLLLSHMPQSLLACLGPWFQDLMILLEAVELEKKMDLPEQEPRLKTWKRVLQLIFKANLSDSGFE
ncbi:hypothetical protein M758_11G038100 [Ceratodon purpureus]|nr:hypothetical protein M758_11G038100 [Ceratodon purpureus]